MSERNQPVSERDIKVRQANKAFYDMVADVYEEIDGRRTHGLNEWLTARLRVLSLMNPKIKGGTLVDFGCGSGLVMRCAHGLFENIIGIDLSEGILKKAREEGMDVICGEADAIPLRDESVDVLVCFAALHHIPNHAPLIAEIARVLKPRGVLYTEHDMDLAFSSRYSLPLRLYRTLFDAGKKYVDARRGITRELYELTEVHSEGIDSDLIERLLKAEGFSEVRRTYHWFGLNPHVSRIMGHREYGPGNAPVVSIFARK